jgi:adenylate cyclase
VLSLKALKAKFDWRMLLLLPLPLLWALASHEGLLRFADDRLVDFRFRARGEIDAPLEVIYVDIDPQAIEELGNFPWQRDYFAVVCRALDQAGKAKAIGIDVVFSEKGVSEAYDRERWVLANRTFMSYLLREPNPPVVVAASYAAAELRAAHGQRTQIPFPLIRDGLPPLDQIEEPEVPEIFLGTISRRPPRIGLIDTEERGTRWVPLFAPTGVKRYDHLALYLALLYWDASPDDLQIHDDVIAVIGRDKRLITTIPLTYNQSVEINWFSRWLSPRNPRVSFSVAYIYAQMLESEKPEEREKAAQFFAQFTNSVVLIGPTDPLLQDVAVTPTDDYPVPKVGVHGNLVKTLVSGQYLQRLPVWAIYPITFVFTGIVTLFSMAGGARGLRSKLTALLVLVAYVWVSFELFKNANVVLPMAAPLGSAFTTAFLGVVWQLVIEEKQKGRIKGMFSAYLAPTVVNSLIDSGKEPELGGHEETITAYFSDIQSFSTFSEVMSPAQLVELMNEYLTVCTDIVQEEGGTLDKYIGDAVVAMFGAPLALPDHAFRACTATIRVQKAIVDLRAKWKGEEGKWPVIVHYLRARLGLNTGKAIIGNMGSRTRFSYTMMGDNVNLAARMESGAKSLGVYTMVTDTTRVECEKFSGDKIVFRFLDKIVVKGRKLPVPVHEVVGFRSELNQQTLDCLATHAKAIEHYLRQDWDGAIKLFEQASLLEPYQPNKAHYIESNPSLIMIERCHYWQAHPPGPNWDGVFTMKEK